MSEIKGDYGHIGPMARITPNKYQPQQFSTVDIIRCEDCPAGKICKKIGNYRESCDPNKKSTNGHDNMAKCAAGTNLLLAHLIESIKEKNS